MLPPILREKKETHESHLRRRLERIWKARGGVTPWRSAYPSSASRDEAVASHHQGGTTLNEPPPLKTRKTTQLLEVPDAARLEMLHKYTSSTSFGLEGAVDSWEDGAAAVVEREQLLVQLKGARGQRRHHPSDGPARTLPGPLAHAPPDRPAAAAGGSLTPSAPIPAANKMELQSSQALLSGVMKTGLEELSGGDRDGPLARAQRRSLRVSVYDKAAADAYDEEYAQARTRTDIRGHADIL